MKRYKGIIITWIVGAAICGAITALLVHVAFQLRGYWAIGGEYSLIPLTIVICTWQTDRIQKRSKHEEEIAIHSIISREP